MIHSIDVLLDLEISKPQKNTRNAVATAAGNSLRAGYNKISRSPDYGLVVLDAE